MNKRITDLGLSKRITGALERAGIETIEQLKSMTDIELNAIRGISDKSIAEIHEVLKPKNEKIETSVTYIFTKKKFIKAEGRKAYAKNKSFVNKMNGRVVDITSNEIKRIWCITK